MKRGLIITSLLFVLSMLFAYPAKADSGATFSVSSDRSSYNVGDTVQVSFSVDAGTYSSTLSVIDMTIQLSDAMVMTPADTTTPFVAGTIYSQVNLQEINGSTI